MENDGAETETPRGGKAVNVVNGTQDALSEAAADGVAHVGGVEEYYTCDGGCNKAKLMPKR